MKKKLLKSEIQKILIQELSKKVHFAMIFGSFFSKRFNQESDIDIACYFRRRMSLTKKLLITSRLEKKIGHPVDLIVLNGADIIITMQVIEFGKFVINHKPDLFYQFKAQKISEYIDFKMSRKIIEDHLIDR